MSIKVVVVTVACIKSRWIRRRCAVVIIAATAITTISVFDFLISS
jgi:hypothetical protein